MILKKNYVLILAGMLLALTLVGCDLLAMGEDAGVIVFWAEVEEGGTATKPYNSDGYFLLMSRGTAGGEGFSESEKSDAVLNNTEFTVTVDGSVASGINKDWQELNNQWFVVESFALANLERGVEYEIIGTTEDTSTDMSETGTLSLTISTE